MFLKVKNPKHKDIWKHANSTEKNLRKRSKRVHQICVTELKRSSYSNIFLCHFWALGAFWAFLSWPAPASSSLPWFHFSPPFLTGRRDEKELAGLHFSESAVRVQWAKDALFAVITSVWTLGQTNNPNEFQLCVRKSGDDFAAGNTKRPNVFVNLQVFGVQWHSEGRKTMLENNKGIFNIVIGQWS